MTKTKSTKHALIMSMMALVLCFTMLLGTTFAWFTDSVTSAGNKIMSGTLKVDLELLDKANGWASIKESKAPIFNYDKWEPGYTDVKILKIENEGTLALKWKARFVSDSELSILADVIDVYVLPSATELTYPDTRDLESLGYQKVGTVREFVNTIETTTTGKLEADEVAYLGIALKMQESAGNDYQDKSLGNFDILILATQLDSEEDAFGADYDADAPYPSLGDKWDGTTDDSWYDENATELVIENAEQFASFAALVNGGNTFSGKTVKLADHIDLTNKEWTPIGNWNTSVFSGIFDGQDHTISNLTMTKTNASGTERLGLFGYIKNATIQNLTVEGAEISADAKTARGAVLVMCADGASNTISGITIKDSSVTMKSAAQTYACGVVAWANAGTSMNMGDITVSNLTLTASQTDSSFAKVASVMGYLYNADGKASCLDGFDVSNVIINVTSPKASVGGVLADTNKGSLKVLNGNVSDVAMTVNGSGEKDIGGVVGYTYKVDHLTVENVAVDNCDIDFSGSSSRVGGVTGWDQSVSDYKNVRVSGSINENITTGSGSEVGGFVGISYYYPKTYNGCSSDVDVVTGGVAGGFVGTSCTNGWANQTDAYTDCIARGDVAADTAGGFVGKGWLTNNTTLALTNVESHGSVTGKYQAGGLLGGAWQNNKGGNVVIKNYVASKNVVGTTSTTLVGEIVGDKWVNNFTVEN